MHFLKIPPRMESNVLGFIKILLAFSFISYNVSLVVSEEYTPAKSEVPFHNLIPRFKMPRGNLLRYKIPQWEVLYFLKYGIVPFIFYDPNFNRTNFVSQVHKFKMYFDEGKPSSMPQSALKDDESFREFLRKNDHPNYNKLPENALSRNNKMMEEINGLLQAVSKGNLKDETGNEEKSLPLTSLDILMEDIHPGTSPMEKTVRDPRKRTVQKRSTKGPENNTRTRQSFWDTFIYRYPLSWKYRKTFLLGSPRDIITDPPPGVTRDRGSFPYTMPRLVSLSELRRFTKSSRIGIRNGNVMEGGNMNSESDDEMRMSGAGNGPRRDGKKFQTQGWR